MGKVRVLVIDDSALTRAVLTKILQSDDDIEVVGTASDPIIAQKKILLVKPDVLTLDLEMPRMDGLTFLSKQRVENPIPTIVISGNSPRSSSNAIKSLELGAIDIIEKPDISTPEKLNEVSSIITERVKTAKAAKQIKYKLSNDVHKKAEIRISGKRQNNGAAAKQITLIGASTGGPDIIRHLFSNINNTSTAYVIAQHMPALFTKSFAERINEFSSLHVKEAEDGDYLKKGEVLVLPGHSHGVIQRNINGYYLSLNQNEKVNRHRPSVDVLFMSGTKIKKENLKAVLLTGMGEDGAKGLKKLHAYGAQTIAQNARSCVVYGMPKKAVEIGAASAVLSPEEIINAINEN